MSNNWAWMLMGPNGAGKSTFRQKIMPHLSGLGNIKQINLDDYAAELAPPHQEQFTEDEMFKLHQQAAVIRNETMDQCVNQGKSFLVESVYSDGGLGTRLTTYDNLHKQGWKLGAILIGLSSLEQSEQRVQSRVSKGGHGTALVNLRDNWHCSVLGARTLLENCDYAYIYDNSKDTFKLIAKKDRDGFSFKDQSLQRNEYPENSYIGEIVQSLTVSPKNSPEL